MLPREVARLEVHPDHEGWPLARSGPDGVQVQGALVKTVRHGLLPRDRLEVDQWHFVEQRHRLGIRQGLLVVVPLGALQDHLRDIRAVLGHRRDRGLILLEHREVEGEGVDGYHALPRRGLQQGREEAGRVRQASDPEDLGNAHEAPGVQLLDAVDEVGHPAAQGLQRGVGEEPGRGHLAREESVHDGLLLLADDDEALDALLQELHRVRHRAQEDVVALDLLEQAHLQGRVVALVAVAHVLPVDGLRQLLQEGLAGVHDHGRLAGALPAIGARGVALQPHDQLQHQIRVRDRGGDLRVHVLPERLGHLVERQLLDVGAVGLQRGVLGDVVGRQRGEHELGVQRLRADVLGHVRAQHPVVRVLRHAAAVVRLGDEVADGVPGDLVRVQVDVDRQDVLADVEVGVVEVVADVPAQELELPALQEDRVEEAEAEEEPAVLVRLADAVVALLRGVHQETVEVGLQALRRLGRHLDAVLQQLDGELGRRRGGEEDAEVLVRLRLDGVEDQLLEVGQPADAEVAVRQERPEALLRALDHELRGLGLLALAQGDVGRLDALHNGEGGDLRRGVHAGREDEEQRRGALRLLVDQLEVQRWRLHELGVQLLADEHGRGRDHAVGADAADHEELLHHVQAPVPLPGQGLALGLRGAVPLLPVAERLLHGGLEAPQRLDARVHLHDVVPDQLRDPVGRGVRGLSRAVQDLAAQHEEVELHGVQLAVRHQDPGAEVEGEDHLVPLEERAAAVLVDRQRVVVVEVLDALLDAARRHLLLGAPLDALDEEHHVGFQGELVHRVDGHHVVQHEVEHGGAQAGGPVALARDVDLYHGLLRHGDLLGHRLADHLGLLQGVDEAQVVEEGALRLRQEPQDLVLELHEAVLALGHLHDELVLLLLHARLLLAHDDAQELVREPVLHHDEVHDRRLRGDLRRVVRVRELRGDVEHEVLIVVEDVLADLDGQAAAAVVDDVLGEHRLERRVQLLPDVLQEDGGAELDGPLDRPHDVLRVRVEDLDLPGGLHLAHPLVALVLGVDQQREAAALRGEDAVLGAEEVRGQRLDVPLADLAGVGQEAGEGEVLGHGDLELDHRLVPLLVDEAVAVRGAEGAGVAHEGGGDDAVAEEALLLLVEAAERDLPADLLTGEAVHELVGALELRLEVLRHLREVGALLVGGLELGVQRRHLLQDLLELGHGLRQLPLLDLQLLLGVPQLQPLRLHLAVDLGVDLHRVHPLAQRAGRRRDVGHELRGEARVLRELLDLAEHRVLDVVLVEVLDPREELDVVQLHLGLRPGGRLLHDGHHGAERLHDHVRGRLVGLHLRDGLLVQLLQGVHGGLQRRHRLLEVPGRVLGDGPRLRGLLPDAELVRLHLLLLDVGLAALLCDHDEELRALLGLHLADPLLLLQVDAHLGHLRAGVVQLAQAVPQLVGGGAELLLLLPQHRHVALHQLQVVRGRHVVHALLRDEHLRGVLGHRGVRLPEDLGHGVAVLLVQVPVREELHGDLGQGLRRPGQEPDGRRGAHEGGVHAAVVAEGAADVGEAEDHVQVLAHAADEEVVERLRRLRHLGLLRRLVD
mmetsp:Transcript_40364/g.119668  ORF Transcript_40364/g.119668 Transcript_40364/m.119668 type:complete len:1559 (+) Transcript_40364:130-4806(+)